MTIDEERAKIIAAKAGDEAAATELVEAYMPLIKHAAGIVNKRFRYELYDDALGTAQLAFWRCVVDFDEGRCASFAAYAKLRVIGAVKDLLRKDKGGGELPLEYAANESAPAKSSLLIDCSNLTDMERKVAKLLYEGYKEREIAGMVNRSQQAVSKTKLRLKAKIKSALLI